MRHLFTCVLYLLIMAALICAGYWIWYFGSLETYSYYSKHPAGVWSNRELSHGQESVQSLIDGLRQGNSEDRALAAQYLALIGPDAEDAVPDLMDALIDPSPTTREWVARALGRMGPAALEALPALEKAKSDQSSNVRTAVSDAIGAIQDLSHFWEREMTKVDLKDIDGDRAVEEFKPLLEDRDPFHRFIAISFLGELGPKGHKALPALKERLHDERRFIRQAAHHAIGKIEDQN